MTESIHIVTHFAGLGGTEIRAVRLAKLLAATHPTQLWADQPTPAAARFGATTIQPFSGRMPRGGILILIGSHLGLGIWIDHARPRRLVVSANLSNPQQLFALLTLLERPTLPRTEIEFASRRLKASTCLPGFVAPPMVDIDRFLPTNKMHGPRFTIGRLSRDIPQEHHPDDPSLYRMLAWRDFAIRLMGANCIAGHLQNIPGLECLAADSEPPPAFLASLDLFFYRTHPTWREPSGLVVAEALASGVPVVADSSGGYTDWIEQGREGFLVTTQEEAFEHILLLARCEEKRIAMGKQARQRAEQIAGPEAMRDYIDWLTA